MEHEQEQESRIHIAINTTEEEPDDTVDIVVYDNTEHRIDVFEADTGLPTKTTITPSSNAARSYFGLTAGSSSTASNRMPTATTIVELSPG